MKSVPRRGKFLGARVSRVEDLRVLTGRTLFVGDVQLPDTVALVFLRSTHAHARIVSIDVSRAAAAPGVIKVLTGEDLTGVLAPLRVDWNPDSIQPPHRPCDWFILARDVVRFFGEAVAAVVATDTYMAEDARDLIHVEYEPMSVLLDAERALEPDAPILHPGWEDNVMFKAERDCGNVARAFKQADLKVSQRFKTGRQTALPLETRGCVASYDRAREELTFWSSSQIPHVLRTHLARLLKFPENRLRVIAPDVGGGFGQKAHVFPEEVLTAYLSVTLERPVKWIEERNENLSSALHAKEQVVDAEIALSNDGSILGLKARLVSDIGAYTEYPWTSWLEVFLAGNVMPGPYKIPAYSFKALAVCTNKTTLGVYRGVGAPVATFVIERLLDIAARRLHLDPVQLRLNNMIRKEDHPYTNVAGAYVESGSHREALSKAAEIIGYADFRSEQKKQVRRGRHLGLGVASFIEVSAPGTQFLLAGGSPRTAGWESARAQMDISGKVTIAVGTHSHGQGHETVFAQLAADELGVDIADVSIRYGDTAVSPLGWGTNASRSAVVGGGATLKAARILRDKILRFAAKRTEIPDKELELADGFIRRIDDGRAIAKIADIAHDLIIPADGNYLGEEPGLDTTVVYEPPMLTNSNATHLATVEVDIETGQVKILRYVVVEDCGTVINPAIVEGQIQGGVTQGIGGALYEHIVYDSLGRLMSNSLMDYLPPTATEVPTIEIAHLESPSPHTMLGIKGMGEGGAVGPWGAIANAVEDALAPFDVCVSELPLTPERILSLLNRSARLQRATVGEGARL